VGGSKRGRRDYGLEVGNTRGWLGWCELQRGPPAKCAPDNPLHVMPAHAGIHRDAANHTPGGGGLVGRRDKHGDDVGGAFNIARVGKLNAA